MTSRVPLLLEETSVFNYQYPGEEVYGPYSYSGIDGSCYCCYEACSDSFYAIVNPPGDIYIGKYTYSDEKFLIPYAQVKLCPECINRNKNVLMRCSSCHCCLIPEADYRIDTNLEIWCENCSSAFDNSIEIIVWDNKEIETSDLYQSWSQLQKYPLVKENPYIKTLLESH